MRPTLTMNLTRAAQLLVKHRQTGCGLYVGRSLLGLLGYCRWRGFRSLTKHTRAAG